jgi:hypothetical protein
MRMEIKGGVLLDLIEGAQGTGREEGLMKMSKSKWVLKTVSKDDVILFACRVTSDAMKEYSQGGIENLGFRYGALRDAVSSRQDNVLLEFDETSGGSRKLHVVQSGYDAGLTLTNPEYIEGKTDKNPSIDYAVCIEGDLDVFSDFVSRCDSIVGGGWFMVSPRPEGLYMYSEEDNQDLYRKVDWDDFDNVSINWGAGFDPGDVGVGHDNAVVPEESKACDTIFSMDWAKDLNYLSDKGRLYLDNHAPMKMVFDMPDGVDATYFFSPRIPTSDSVATLPDSVSDERVSY